MAPSLPGRLLALAAALAAGAARAALPDPWADAPPQAILLYDDPAPGATSLPWRLENRGGERAEDVAVFAEPTWRDPADGPAALSDPVSLEPGEAVEATFELGPPPGPGVWFVPIRVAGWDAAGRPTRSWRCPRFVVPGPKASPPLAFSVAPGTAQRERGRSFAIYITLLSRSDEPVEANVRLLVPSGLAPADIPTIRVSLAPGETLATNFAFRASSPFAQEATVRAVAWTAPATNAPAWGESRYVRFDVAAQPGVLEAPPRRLPWGAAAAAAVWFAACAALGARRRRRNGDENGAAPGGFRWEELAVVVAATAYLAWFLRAWLVFAPGLVLGGDLPAHHYLIDHIARTGSMVSWADGWWGGFPMFRYYFPLPYAAMAALGRIVGHDLAFKLGSIAGLLALPAALWGAARIARLPRPAPAFLAALALPLALDNTHNMWGANAYSTLAGMIANSWSFALFPVALALGARDARRERVSAVSALVFAALALSHFFTSLLAALALGAFALALLAARRPRAFRALAIEGALAAALAAWWLLPLLATGGWSVAFGEQWEIRFWRQLPPMLAPAWLAAAAAATAAAAAMQNAECRMQNIHFPSFIIHHSSFIILHFLLFAFSLLLFYYGRSVAEVFVNCRLWPFLVYAMLVGVALAWATLARAWRAPRAGALAFLALCAALAWRVSDDDGNPSWACAQHARYWAEYNLRGVEAQPRGPSFAHLARLVRWRPGLVAWDMTDLNEALGSSRCFEALPYVWPGTRTLEGGIVNSALGSLAAYTVQGEISDAPAGWPLLVSPRAFDPASGLRHLELLGVRTFIARSRAVQRAFEDDPAWRRIGASGPGDQWKVYASSLEGVPDVRAWRTPLRGRDPAAPPPAASAAPGELQAAIAAWWASRGATEDLFPLDGPDAVPLVDAVTRIAEDATNAPPEPGWLDRVSDPVRLGAPFPDGSIAFETDFPGRPHVVAATWYPDWRADGADGPYLLSSGQMVVYPTGPSVVLYHATLASEIAGRFLALCGLLALAALVLRRPAPRRAAGGWSPVPPKSPHG